MNYSVCQPHCGPVIKSNCADDITTKWNKISVGERLRKWIISIHKITSNPQNEDDNFSLTKRIVMFGAKYKNGSFENRGINSISNYDCSIKRNIGPSWKKASVFSVTQFHDGFLYGMGDENGNPTKIL